ncbi:alpha/beta hydrolase [Cellulomonas sp. KRMCY2]|uniref:alpha/beta hydrolase n=1 Tax=Cellulomonas sp. KRMCY2 TaxID=1304865 RepID=UPI0012DC4746|nr:alpha/beta hydrolase [Cellulomonas sp. KRMCY2]
MTAPLLRSWRPGALEVSSGDIEAIRRTVDTATGEFTDVTALTRNGVWEGDAADAAAANARTTLRRLDVLNEALGMLRRSLVAAADALTAAKALLDRADDLAGQYGMRVSTQGYVTFRGDRAQEPDAYRAAKDAERFAQEAIRAAWEADRDAAHAVRSIFTAAADGSTSDPTDRALVTEIALRDIPAADAHPRFVAAWWTSLSATARALLIARHPERIGNLDGVPVAARDRANRSVLTTTISGLAATLTGLQARLDALGPITGRAGPSSPHVQIAQQMADAREQLTMLEAVRDELGNGAGDYHLMLLDTELPGRAAIAIGDVATADHIAVLVPGMGSHVTNYMHTITENAARVEHTASAISAAGGGSGTVATIAWIGYHAPMDIDVLSDHAARQGAPALASTLWGIRESRVVSGDAPHVTAVTHSYGSLVGGLTARTDAPMDDWVLIGSPGVGAETVGEMGRSEDHVFVGTADGDLVGLSGNFSRRPDSDYFGATQFQTDGGSHPLAEAVTLEAEGHSEYYGQNTESLWNISSVITGHPEAVTVEPNAGEDQP